MEGLPPLDSFNAFVLVIPAAFVIVLIKRYTIRTLRSAYETLAVFPLLTKFQSNAGSYTWKLILKTNVSTEKTTFKLYVWK